VHGADFGSARPHADWPDYFGETIAWLNTYLKAPARPSR